MKEYIVTKEEAGLRLDKYLKHCLPDQSRSHLVKCIEEEKVLVNDQKMKPSYFGFRRRPDRLRRFRGQTAFIGSQKSQTGYCL